MPPAFYPSTPGLTMAGRYGQNRCMKKTSFPAAGAPGATGKRTKYTNRVATAICEAVEDGLSLRAACDAAGVRYSTAHGWIKDRPAFAERYSQACKIRTAFLEERLLDLLNEARRAAFDSENGNRLIQAIKLEIETLKWQLSKLLPKKYGDRTQMVVEGANPADVLPKHTAEEDAAFLRMLVEIQAKTPPPPEYTT